jgi:hypothetical protein
MSRFVLSSLKLWFGLLICFWLLVSILVLCSCVLISYCARILGWFVVLLHSGDVLVSSSVLLYEHWYNLILQLALLYLSSVLCNTVPVFWHAGVWTGTTLLWPLLLPFDVPVALFSLPSPALSALVDWNYTCGFSWVASIVWMLLVFLAWLSFAYCLWLICSILLIPWLICLPCDGFCQLGLLSCG